MVILAGIMDLTIRWKNGLLRHKVLILISLNMGRKDNPAEEMGDAIRK